MSVPTERPPGPMPPSDGGMRDPRDYIDPRDFASVVHTVLDNNPGMEGRQATRITCEAIKFVVAGAMFPEHAMAPSRIVDEGWHALIVHTELYARLCAKFGPFVHHTPGYNPMFFDPPILDRTEELIRAAGFEVDEELWVGPTDDRIPVAANCQHSPNCQIRPMPKPEKPCTSPGGRA
ncbi:hypothetical protein LN042_04870 [Kitasatospora sp. RB6PN24]|uniref:glycine-rich domain-containing protein n=1 Tax=Kitasatospora humi TaxID=2893891 RepID=UPI001E383B81|nr:hypothetical protein [Kitasatospora humi]MCC9306447.1 hypothetical protein [Kitasatospora humi]